LFAIDNNLDFSNLQRYLATFHMRKMNYHGFRLRDFIMPIITNACEDESLPMGFKALGLISG
jgi:hypothetical protein